MHIVERNEQDKIIMVLGQTLIISSLTCMLLHFQVSSSVPCYKSVLPSRGLGMIIRDDPCVWTLQS